jgi:hypothetical protein
LAQQRSSRKRRKARRRKEGAAGAAKQPVQEPAADASAEVDADTGAAADSDDERMARGYSRGRARDEQARAALVPLGPGERPRAVMIAGVVALILALSNFGSYVAGVEVQGERPNAIGVGLFTLLLLSAAIGCFRVRYWAVLGMQALLGLVIVVFSLLLIRFGDLLELAIAVAIIGSAGTLFWFLVKSMARIQMPERPEARQ